MTDGCNERYGNNVVKVVLGSIFPVATVHIKNITNENSQKYLELNVAMFIAASSWKVISQSRSQDDAF